MHRPIHPAALIAAALLGLGTSTTALAHDKPGPRQVERTRGADGAGGATHTRRQGHVTTVDRAAGSATVTRTP
jgi:hypothetical protein